MSYESGESVPIDEIQGAVYDPEIFDKIHNNNSRPFEDTMDNLSEATLDSEEDNLRRNIISNISLPEISGKRVINVKGNPFIQVYPGGNVTPKL